VSAITFQRIPTKQAVRSELVRMIYVGPDDHFRIPILKRAGYSVDQCKSACQLHAALRDIASPPDAVVIVEKKRIDPRAAMFLTRSTSAAALVLFQSADHTYDESGFDFVVPVLPSVDEWLGGIATLIERRRSDRDRTQGRLSSVWQPAERISRLSRVG